MNHPKTYILVLNYKKWKDTIECLESIYRLNYPDFGVIVIDNDSQDDSVDKIAEWAEGRLTMPQGIPDDMKVFSDPPVKKPICCRILDRDSAEKGRDGFNGCGPAGLVIIRSGRNGGYAFGNNIGIKYARQKNDAKYIWILNNDTVVEPDSLAELVKKAEEYSADEKKIGLIASKMLYYYDKKKINGAGGIYYKWYGGGRLQGFMKKDDGRYDRDSIKFNYVPGAAMFVTLDFIRDTGNICEDYFIYYEEMDWALRGAEKGYGQAYSHKSVVYHKEGTTIKHGIQTGNSYISGRALKIDNRILFTKKFYPGYVWIVYMMFLPVLIFRHIRGIMRSVVKFFMINRKE